MSFDAERWDARHAAAGPELPPPDPFVVSSIAQYAGLDDAGRSVPGPQRRLRVVDLAAGRGRHALWLAEQGHEVEAWDVSAEGLRRLREEAAARRLSVATRTVDLEGDWPQVAAFDLALLVDFLSRPVLARVPTLLAPGGRLVFTTFTDDHPGPHPRAEFRLRRDELADGVPGLIRERFEERDGRAGLVAVRTGPRG